MSDASADPLSQNMRGALYMSASMAGFSSNDAMIKLVSGDLPLFQAILMRGSFLVLLLGAIAWGSGALRIRLGRSDRWIMTLRTAGEIGGTFCFLTALFNMPIANASAILQSLPLAITLAAAIFFAEPVGWRRYLAIAIGFVGVLVIVRPGSEGFNSYSLFAVAAIGFIVLRDLSTRALSPAVPSLYAAFVTGAAITVAAGIAVVALGDWVTPEPRHFGILGIGAMCLIVGYIFGVMSMRTGQIAVVSPFRYTLLIWAIGFGWLLFGERPDAFMLVGSAIIVGTGLYTFYRERRLGALERQRIRDATPD